MGLIWRGVSAGAGACSEETHEHRLQHGNLVARRRGVVAREGCFAPGWWKVQCRFAAAAKR